jgi:hypothetical protein
MQKLSIFRIVCSRETQPTFKIHVMSACPAGSDDEAQPKGAIRGRGATSGFGT